MEKDYWLSRWEANDIKFHQLEINSYLIKFFSLLNLKNDDRVLVPLCGKTNDMLWLRAQQLQVIGVELSQKACEEFFVENNLNYSIEEKDGYIKFNSDGIKLICGDFFKLPKSMVGQVNAIYDRGSLIALPSEYRQAYINEIIALFDPNTSILLISLETSKETKSPPFGIDAVEIHTLYDKYFAIKQLAKVPEKTAHLLAKGYSDLYNVVYLLNKI